MKHTINQWMARLCNISGTIAAVYIGGWMMFLMPLGMLYTSYMNGTISISLVLFCGVKILLSATFAGFVWCIGYIGSNYFKGDEDPDWTLLNPGTQDQDENIQMEMTNKSR